MDLDISNIALWGQQQEKFLKRTTTGHTGIGKSISGWNNAAYSPWYALA